MVYYPVIQYMVMSIRRVSFGLRGGIWPNKDHGVLIWISDLEKSIKFEGLL